MDIRKLFGLETENENLVGMTEAIMDESERIMKKALVGTMKFENIQDMSSEDFELIRESSALWKDYKDCAMKAAERLDQMEDLKKEVEKMNKKLDYYNELLSEIKTNLREIAEKKDA